MPRLLSIVEQLAPAEALRPFIRGYIFRTASIGLSEAPVTKAMPLRCVSSIDFFMGDTFETKECRTTTVAPFARCTIRGPRTYRKYTISLNGQLVSFSIRFTPAGLYALLGMPAELFRDEAVDGATVLPQIFPEVTERLMGCFDIQGCVEVVEPYLLQLCKRTGAKGSPAVTHMAGLIAAENGAMPISRLQREVCLGKRQLERNFVKEVGVSPKMYSRMLRFSLAVQHKINHSSTGWAALAYEFGYADQMHLIKDFHQFLSLRPSEFSAEDFAF